MPHTAPGGTLSPEGSGSEYFGIQFSLHACPTPPAPPPHFFHLILGCLKSRKTAIDKIWSQLCFRLSIAWRTPSPLLQAHLVLAVHKATYFLAILSLVDILCYLVCQTLKTVTLSPCADQCFTERGPEQDHGLGTPAACDGGQEEPETDI